MSTMSPPGAVSSPLSITIQSEHTATNNGPVMNRKQRRRLEKRMRSASTRALVRHVKNRRAKEQGAIRNEAMSYARSELGAHGKLDIDLSDALDHSMKPIEGSETAEREARGEYEHKTFEAKLIERESAIAAGMLDG